LQTDLFDADISEQSLSRFADAATSKHAFEQLAAGESEVAVEMALLRDGRTWHALGGAAPRERIWIQCDAAYDAGAAAFTAWAVLDSLTSKRVNRYRHLLLGRARIAVVTPARPRRRPLPTALPPLLDAGALGATPDVVEAMDAFAPTLVVHVQDWSMSGPSASSPGSRPPLAGAGARLVESYYIDRELHARLGSGAGWRGWFGRPGPLARAIAAHPDAPAGQYARTRATAMGYRVFDRADERQAVADPTLRAAVQLSTGRYVPRVEWRRLGASTLCEVALGRYGAAGFCVQVFASSARERAGQALALAEGLVLHRSGLESAARAA
jgi:hypothetical protein